MTKFSPDAWFWRTFDTLSCAACLYFSIVCLFLSNRFLKLTDLASTLVTSSRRVFLTMEIWSRMFSKDKPSMHKLAGGLSIGLPMMRSKNCTQDVSGSFLLPWNCPPASTSATKICDHVSKSWWCRSDSSWNSPSVFSIFCKLSCRFMRFSRSEASFFSPNFLHGLVHTCYFHRPCVRLNYSGMNNSLVV